jgi:plasmid maintenance system antidote protein VapI
MTSPATVEDLREHFAQCVQVLGGVTAAARRLGIDERAIRRFISGERPISERLLLDTAAVLKLLAADATAAERHIVAALGSEPNSAT